MTDTYTLSNHWGDPKVYSHPRNITVTTERLEDGEIEWIFLEVEGVCSDRTTGWELFAGGIDVANRTAEVEVWDEEEVPAWGIDAVWHLLPDDVADYLSRFKTLEAWNLED